MLEEKNTCLKYLVKKMYTILKKNLFATTTFLKYKHCFEKGNLKRILFINICFTSQNVQSIRLYENIFRGIQESDKLCLELIFTLKQDFGIDFLKIKKFICKCNVMWSDYFSRKSLILSPIFY